MDRKQRWRPLRQIRDQVDSHATIGREESALLAVLCGAFLLRVYALEAESLWLDEFYSVAIRAPLTGMAQFSAQDPHPPLYYYLLHYWVEVVGNSPSAVRLLSVVFGVAAVFMMYKLGSELSGPRVGIISAIFVAVSPMYILYSRQARMYSLHVFLAIASFYFLAKVLTSKREITDVAAYIIITALLLYTHVFALFLVAAQNLYLLVHRRQINQNHDFSLKQWTGLQADIGILFLPWIGRLADQVITLLVGTGSGEAEGFDISWITMPTPSSVLETLQIFSGFINLYPFDQAASVTRESSLFVLAVFAVVIAFLVLRIGLQDTSEYQQLIQNVHLSALWLGIPILGAYTISHLIQPVYASRFLIAASGGLYLLVAIGITRIRSNVAQILIVGLIVTGSLFAVGAYYETDTREDWKGASNYIEGHSDSNDVILVARSFGAPVDYYLESSHPDLLRYPNDVTTDQDSESRPATASGSTDRTDIRQINAEYEQIWVVSIEYAEPTDLYTQLNETRTLEQRRQFGLITVSQFSEESTSTTAEQSSLTTDHVTPGHPSTHSRSCTGCSTVP